MHGTGVPGHKRVEALDDRREREQGEAEKLCRSSGGLLEDPLHERAVGIGAGENDRRKVRETVGECREFLRLPLLQGAARARVDSDEGALRDMDETGRLAPISIGNEVVGADRAFWHDLGEESSQKIHVLVVPASLLVPPRAVGEKGVPAGVPIAGPKLRPGKRHQEEYAHVSLEIESEVEGVPAESGAGAGETGFLPPGGPGSVDYPYAVDEG